MARNWQLDMPTHDAYWMDRVLFDIHHVASDLVRYQAGPDLYMQGVPLPPAMKAAIRDNDIGTMYLAGVNPYLLRAHFLGLQIPERTYLDALKAVGGKAGTEVAHG